MMASVSGKYEVEKKIDKFNDNQVRVTMRGGIIDVDPIGAASNAAKFNPFIVKSKNGNRISSGIIFSLERVTRGQDIRWLNIRKGDKAIFLLDDGRDKVVLLAETGSFDSKVKNLQGDIYTTYYDLAIYSATPAQIQRIANAAKVEVRVSGMSSYEEFPRQPNYKLYEGFLPNLKKFYETEIKPYE